MESAIIQVLIHLVFWLPLFARKEKLAKIIIARNNAQKMPIAHKNGNIVT